MSKDLENKIIGTDLCKLAGLLYDYNLCQSIAPLNSAGQSCISTATETSWRYVLNKLVFKADEVGGRIPCDSEDIFVSLSIKIQGEEKVSETIENPLTELFFNIEIEGFRLNENSQDVDNLYAAWHLDKHITTTTDENTKYSHPLYHFAFGGNKMEARNNDFGICLILPTPRFCYPPMDAVLGIDFILQNYVHKEKRDKLIGNPQYVEIVKSSQKRLWHPFFSSLYSHWDSTSFNVAPDFIPQKLFPLYY